jgi:hypothetical protein
MARMQRLLQPDWVATFTAVGTGGGTAYGMSMEVFNAIVGGVGAACAVISTIAAIYFHRKNTRINAERLADEKQWHNEHPHN